MLEISVKEAETKLSEIISKAVAGEEIVITEAGEQVVKLIPVKKPRHKWVGKYQGEGRVLDSFFEPLDDDETVQYLTGDKF